MAEDYQELRIGVGTMSTCIHCDRYIVYVDSVYGEFWTHGPDEIHCFKRGGVFVATPRG